MVQDLTQITRRLRNAQAWQWIRPLVLSDQEHPLLVRRECSGSVAFRPYYHGEEAGWHCTPRQLEPAWQVNLSTTSDDCQHCLCHLCWKKGHHTEWCWTPHKWCPEGHCRVKSTHAYYACGPLCETTTYNIEEPLPEDEDDDSFNIEERPED
jgi:hypothetical protein